MTDRPTPPPADDDDASDWLASQFDPTGAVPKQQVPPVAPPQFPGAQPPAVQPPAVQPPAVQRPIAQPPIAPPQFPGAQPPVPPQFPVSQPPAQPTFQPVVQPPVQPQFPAAQQRPTPPVTPPPVTPPAATPPAAAPPPASAPAAPPPPATPPAATPPPATPPAAAPPAGGFSWGLTPGAAPATPPPAAIPPTAIPPAAVPPAPGPPASPGSWFEPDALAPLDPAIAGAPHESQPPAAAMPFETTALPGVAPDARDAPPFWEPEPTQIMDAVELETDRRPEPPPRQPFTRSVFPEGTELLAESSGPGVAATGAPAGETGAVSAIDALFGESQFREYTDGLDHSENPFVRRADEAVNAAPPGARPPRAGISKLQRILLAVLGGMLAVIALIALFFLGIRLPAMFGPAPAVVTPSASPSPSASPVIAVGPVAPGEYHWDELLGGECLDPFESAWQDDYTVVDCAVPHAAQLVHIGTFPLPEDTGFEAFPGEDELQTRALALCQAPGIFSSDVADLKKDALITASYPVTVEAWDAGNRTFSCFVSRASGDPITGDVALPQEPPEPAETPDPAAP